MGFTNQLFEFIFYHLFTSSSRLTEIPNSWAQKTSCRWWCYANSLRHQHIVTKRKALAVGNKYSVHLTAGCWFAAFLHCAILHVCVDSELHLKYLHIFGLVFGPIASHACSMYCVQWSYCLKWQDCAFNITPTDPKWSSVNLKVTERKGQNKVLFVFELNTQTLQTWVFTKTG